MFSNNVSTQVPSTTSAKSSASALPYSSSPHGSAQKTVSISMVIPVYNGGRNFQRCLSSIRRSHRQPDELIVVADGDTDGSWKIAEDFGAQVLRLPAMVGGPSGPAQARNQGARVANSDIIFFMDADVMLHPNTLSLVEQRFDQHSELAALIGSYDDSPGASNFLSQYKNLFHHYTHQISTERASTFWGACGAIRRSVFLSSGGFDERYKKPCIEDIELGYRLARTGHSIRLYKDIQVKHLKRWNVRSLLKADILCRALPWTSLLLHGDNFNTDLNLSLRNRLSVGLVFIWVSSLITSALVSGALQTGVLIIAGLITMILLIVNIDVYRFFYQKRGLGFALRVIPWHWLYFLYGGTTFVIATIHYTFNRLLHQRRRSSTT